MAETSLPEKPPTRIRFQAKSALMILMILAAIISGWYATPSLFIVSILSLGALVIVAFFLFRPEVGILLMIPVAYSIRVELSTGTKVSINASFVLSVVLIGTYFIRMLVQKQENRLVFPRVSVAALLFILSMTISLIAGNIHWVAIAKEGASISAQVGAWSLYVVLILIFLIIGNQIQDKLWVERITWVFLAFGALFILFNVPKNFSAVESRLFNNLGSIVWTWLPALSLGQVLWNKNLHRTTKLLLILFIGIIFYLSIGRFHDWASGWAFALIAVAIMVWLKSWRWGLVFLFIGGVVLLVIFPEILSVIWTPTQQYSLISRLWTYPILFDIIKNSPIIGVGPANYWHYTNTYAINGYYVRFNSHNNFMDILAQSGILGLITFTWFAFELGLMNWKLRSKFRGGDFSQAFINTTFAAYIATLVSGMLGDWFLPFVYNLGFNGFRTSLFFWIFMGCILFYWQQMLKEKPA